MKTNNPKISFNTSPKPLVRMSPKTPDEEAVPQLYSDSATSEHIKDDSTDDFYDVGGPELFEPAPAPKPVGQTAHEHEFDRAEWEQRLTAPTPAPESTPLPLPRAKAQNARLAAFGQRAQPEAGLFARSGGFYGVAAVVGVTLFLGIGTALWFFARGDVTTAEQATFSAPMTEPVFAVSKEAEPVIETATRALTPYMTDVSATVAQAVTPSPSELTAAVLAGIQQQAAEPPKPEESIARLNRETIEILSTNKVRMLREGVLADIYSIETYQQNGVDRVRMRTINAPLVSEFASETLLKAVSAGEIELSRSLITPEGAIDVETMMFNLVQTSLRNDHSTQGAESALGMSRKIFAASVARTQNVNGARVYTVQAGDSLAYIALQFLGDPSAYKRILEVNRNTLQSPEQIQIGQRLIIPS